MNEPNLERGVSSKNMKNGFLISASKGGKNASISLQKDTSFGGPLVERLRGKRGRHHRIEGKSL